jgi:hypothetical protein
MFKSLWDVQARMADYDDKLGIEQHVVLPQFSGWWSYLIEAQLAVRMARSHNEALLRLMKEYPGRILGAALVALQDVASPRNGVGAGERLLLGCSGQSRSSERPSL